MLLIFPSIEIQRGKCVQLVQGEPGLEQTYSIDPVRMAVLWRGENAKTLHVIDVDGVNTGKIQNCDIIRRIVQAVDIPIQVGGGLRDYDDIAALFQVGVHRVVIGTAAVYDEALVGRLINGFGTRRIAIAIESEHGKIRTQGGTRQHDVSVLEFALRMKSLGVARIICSNIAEDGVAKCMDLNSLRSLASQTGMRVTAQGGIRCYKDLIALQDLEKFGVDSVIIGKALYDNRFPCQRLWRLNEKELTDLGPTRRT